MFGRLLRVDLSTGSITAETIPADYTRDFLGGSGLGARLLWDYLDPARPPLHPASPLLWITGPLTGTAGPTNGRFTLCGFSPQTGRWGEANIGGFVGPELRYAGWDAVLVTGRASLPVYLWIHNQAVELRRADHLWGAADTYETQQQIRYEVGEPQAKVACIGQAGERGVIYAGIFSDHGRAAARTGLGALMGAKNLKALAVRGTGRLQYDDLELFRHLRVAANKDLLEQNMTQVFKATGTAGAADYLQILGDMPQQYWTAATFDGAGKISGSEMADTILTGTTACQACVIACGREVQINNGPYATAGKVKGPEYETVCSFGSQIGVDDLAAITALGERCDRLGLDVISAGSAIGLAYLLYARGIINDEDTGGLALNWGDPGPSFTLLEQIANCQGFGALLAHGARALGEHYGVPELAGQVNGLDLGMHDPRAFSGQTLSYVTSPVGGSHNHSDFYVIDMGGAVEELDIQMGDRFESRGKAALVARHQYWRTVCNSLVLCFFAVVPPSQVLGLLNAAQGWSWSLDDLMRCGERSWNLKRLINLRLGLKPADERLPELLLQPLPGGGQEGNLPDLSILLDEYYAACGWDRATGYPTQAKLVELGLQDLSNT